MDNEYVATRGFGDYVVYERKATLSNGSPQAATVVSNRSLPRPAIPR